MSNIDATLNERGARYGEFADNAETAQDLKIIMQESPNWDLMAADQREALEMTAHKIGRILNGDPDYIDSWHDIIGYIRLVEQRLEREVKDEEKQRLDREAREENRQRIRQEAERAIQSFFSFGSNV